MKIRDTAKNTVFLCSFMRPGFTGVANVTSAERHELRADGTCPKPHDQP